MDRGRDPYRRSLHDAVFDHYLRRGGAVEPGSSDTEQWVPVNVYETDDDVVVVAPMPGVEAENIDIELHNRQLTVSASLRGPGQAERRYLVHEWTYGPYRRTVDLPGDVDSRGANASHGNGVLVVTLPKAAHTRPIRVRVRTPDAR